MIPEEILMMFVKYHTNIFKEELNKSSFSEDNKYIALKCFLVAGKNSSQKIQEELQIEIEKR